MSPMDDYLLGHDERCAAVRPGDNGCNCHKAYGYDTAREMEEDESNDN